MKTTQQLFKDLTIPNQIDDYIRNWLDWNEDIHEEMLEYLQTTLDLNSRDFGNYLHELTRREILYPYGGLPNQLLKLTLSKVDWESIASDYLVCCQ